MATNELKTKAIIGYFKGGKFDYLVTDENNEDFIWIYDKDIRNIEKELPIELQNDLKYYEETKDEDYMNDKYCNQVCLITCKSGKSDFYFKGGDSRGEGWKHVIIRSAEIYHSNEYPRLKWVDFHSSINIEKDVWVDYPLTFSLNKENNEEFAEFISAVFEEAKDTVDIQEFIGRELLVNYRINWLQNQYPDGLYPAGYRPYRIKEEKLGGKENED